MIIGSGDIASALKESDRNELLFFASGVSNSQEDRESEYQREKDLFIQTLRQQGNKHFVYFSSLAVFYSYTRYTLHKLEMENLIKEACTRYTIIRLGNITWGDNPHTLINFIRNKIKTGEAFEIRDEYRYIIDRTEFLHWIHLIPPWNCEMNITGNRMKVEDIINKYGYVDVHTE